MRRKSHLILVPLVFLLVIPWGLQARNADVQPDMYWIFFRDKGLQSESALQQALEHTHQQLLPRAAERRANVFRSGLLVDLHDLPVAGEYLQALRELGIQPRTVSKWLNAVSASLDDGQLRVVQKFAYVKKIIPLARSQHVPEPVEYDLPGAVDDSALYGQSWQQAAVVNLPPVHEMGYNGRSVMVGVFDAGFNNLPHQCFDSLNVVATWDFVNGDSNVANHGDIGDGSHGTKTLSVLAGYHPGFLVGPAWGVDVVLAKTENTEEEEPYEEDLWVAGLEWADSLGAQVVSSSLTYMDWYTYEDMDGNTAVTTIAADLAAGRGIAIFNSNGNIRSPEYQKMRAPADGDSVMGIGAVTSDSIRSSFSSYGPTYDGRIKPDLMAMGSGCTVASPYAPDQYQTGSGTSYSCPMAAGLAALLLEVDPTLTPWEIYQALKVTAHQAANPDTVFGWGIINILEAVNWVLSPVPESGSVSIPLGFRLSAPYPNPFNGQVWIGLSVGQPVVLQLGVYDVLGRRVAALYDGQLGIGIRQWVWDPGNVGSGRYWIRAVTPDGAQSVSAVYLK